jgi:diguanylate cyclase (GGDEF)-like protein/PAS domain S-box-containing protein
LTLERRTLITISITLLVMAALLFVFTRTFLLDTFSELETSDVRAHMMRAESALQNDIDSLGVIVGDWAPWDDTYQFVEGEKPTYLEDNLGDSSIANLRLNFIIYVHSSGRVVHAQGFDWEQEQAMSVPEDLLAVLKEESSLLHKSFPGETKGVLLLKEHVALVASAPILTSEFAGPVRGTLLMGRYLNDTEIKGLSDLAHLPLLVRRIDDPTLNTTDKDTFALAIEKGEAIAQVIDSRSALGSLVVDDIFGKPALLLSVPVERRVFEAGRNLSTAFLFVLMLMGAIFTGIMFTLIRRQTISRLVQLGGNVKSIASSGDLGARVAVRGADELTALAREINDMLESLQRYEEHLRVSEERYRGVVEDQTEIICRFFLPDTKLTFVNEACARFFNLSREQMLGRPLLGFLPEPDREKALERIKTLGPENQVAVYEQVLIRPDGRAFWLHWTDRALLNERNEILEIQSVGRDITAIKKVEEELRRLSTTDGLTGAYNRRYFLSRLSEELDRAARYEHPLSIAIFDIDYFKNINDTYGHQVGDRVICALTMIVQERIRKVDVFARWGGEEFILLFPETGKDGAHKATRELCAQLAEIQLLTDFDRISFTVSAGIAEHSTQSPLSLDDLIRSADTALYEAKNSGRNQVRCNGISIAP